MHALRWSSTMTELRPTSLPVPAVVGMAISGASPLQSASPSNWASDLSGRLTRRRMIFPTSSGLPPPRAMTESHLCSR